MPVIAPTTLNGYPVIQSAIHANGYVTVMMERDDDYMPFVVATWHENIGKGWQWGHYFEELEDAATDFNETRKRNNERSF